MEHKHKYTAFISYRHVSPDKEIADRLQKTLESYKPPKALMDGKRSCNWRIFRDETELPTSSNLSNDIKSALEASEFLIVVCSKTTASSRWCMEEIEYFKQLHNGNNANIITLVADGNPEDVFPAALCNELVPVTDDSGNTTYQNHIIEPLAANVSGSCLKESFKKLKTEFLRVAAPILGCGYDNLYNREQKRKTKKIFAFGGAFISLLLLFIIYNSTMLWKINNQKTALAVANEELTLKTKEAEENMLVALENEAKANEANKHLRIKNSEILASQAQMYLDNDDIFTAISTALEALPQGYDGVPDNAMAKYVLTKSLNAYNSSEKIINSKINLSSYVDFVEFSEDGTRLFAGDTMGNIYVIDYEKKNVIESYTILELFDSNTTYLSDAVVDKNTGFVLCSEQLVSVNLEDGSINWQYDAGNALLSIDKIATNPNSDYIYLLGGSYYAVLTKDGREIVPFENTRDTEYKYNEFYDYVYASKDGTTYVVRRNESDICVINQDVIKSYPINISENDEILCVGENDEDIYLNISVSVDNNALSRNNARLICLNKKNLSVKWSTNYKVEGSLYSSFYNTIFDFTHRLPDKNNEFILYNGVLVVSGTHLLCFDKQTGKLYYNVNEDYEELILHCEPNTTEYSVKIATPTTFVNNCYLARKLRDDLSGEFDDYLLCTNFHQFDREHDTIINSGDDKFALVSEKSSEINLYHKVSFENHTALADLPDISGNFDVIVDDGQGVFAGYCYSYVDNELKGHVIIYDVKNDTCMAFFEESLAVKFMAFKNNKLLMFDSEGISKVVDYSGEILEEFDLREKIIEAAGFEQNKYLSISNSFIHLTKNNVVLCIAEGVYTINLSEDHAVVTKILTGKYLDNYALSGTFAAFSVSSYKDENTKIAYFSNDDDTIFYISENGVASEFTRESIVSISNTSIGNKIAFVCKEGYIGLFSHDNGILTKITLPKAEVTPLSVKFTPDGKSLIIMCADGKFMKYNIDNGEFVGEYKSETDVDSYTIFEFMDDDSFYIRKYSSSSDIVVIDVNSMEKLAEIDNFLYFLASERKFVCKYTLDGERKIGCYKYLTTAELIELAETFLRDD